MFGKAKRMILIQRHSFTSFQIETHFANSSFCYKTREGIIINYISLLIITLLINSSLVSLLENSLMRPIRHKSCHAKNKISFIIMGEYKNNSQSMHQQPLHMEKLFQFLCLKDV